MRAQFPIAENLTVVVAIFVDDDDLACREGLGREDSKAAARGAADVDVETLP